MKCHHRGCTDDENNRSNLKLLLFCSLAEAAISNYYLFTILTFAERKHKAPPFTVTTGTRIGFQPTDLTLGRSLLEFCSTNDNIRIN